MNNIEILERLEEMQQTFREDGLQGYEMAIVTAKKLINNLIQENKELKEKINKSIEFINDDDTFFDDGENWQNVLHIERILKGE